MTDTIDGSATTSVVGGFVELFQGNPTAIGTEEGGCSRLDGEGLAVHIAAHLTGLETPIGVYLMVQRGLNVGMEPAPWFVHWGCVDFDEGDEPSLIHARNVQAVLAEFGVTGWVERSRSKGFHLWVFADEWVPAVVMRKALLGACQVVDAPTKEINPKQTQLGTDALGRPKLGNYVRLPYPGHLGQKADAYRRVVIDRSGAGSLTLETFVSVAMANRASLEQLQMVGDTLYVEPRKPQRKVRAPSAPMFGDPQMRLGGKAFVIWRDGPLPDPETGEVKRGKTLYKLACEIYEGGQHTAEEAEELLLDADERWGKFTDRGEPHYITDMVDKIWEDSE